MKRTTGLFLLLVFTASGHAENLLLGPGHGDGGSAWGLAECAACHPLRRIHLARRADNIRDLVERKGYDSCTGCHGNNGTSAPRRCVLCHNRADLPATPHRSGRYSHAFEGMSDDRSCLTCHQASDMDGRLETDQDLTLFPDATGALTPYFGSSEFCIRCHNRDHQQPGFEIPFDDWRDPLVAAEDNYEHLDKHGRRAAGGGTYQGLRPAYRYPDVVACSDCHTMHGTDNDGLLIDLAAKGASRLDPPLAVKAEALNGNYAQLCVLCHDMEQPAQEYWQDTGNGLHGVHQASGDCRPCHQHGQPNQAGL